MLRLLSDENFNGYVVRGLFRHRPKIDLVRVQDVGLLMKDDPAILNWAAQNHRILVTHDKATIPNFAYKRILERLPMPGVFIVSDQIAIHQTIEEILLLDELSEMKEWQNQVAYLPL